MELNSITHEFRKSVCKSPIHVHVDDPEKTTGGLYYISCQMYVFYADSTLVNICSVLTGSCIVYRLV